MDSHKQIIRQLHVLPTTILGKQLMFSHFYGELKRFTVKFKDITSFPAIYSSCMVQRHQNKPDKPMWRGHLDHLLVNLQKARLVTIKP